MPPKDMPWFRFYSEARRDPKIRKAAQCARVSFLEAFGFWAALLTMAGESPVRGSLVVTLLERFTIDDIAYECNTTVEMAQKLIEAFQKFGMVEVSSTLIVSIKNWEKRQFASDHSTERVRKHREKEQCNDNETLPSVSDYGYVSVSVNTSSDSSLNPEEAEFGVLVRRYEQNIGTITGSSADMLGDDLKEYGLQICLDAIDEAVRQNVRKWSYVQGILRKWKTNGRDSPAGTGTKPHPAQDPRRAGVDAFRAKHAADAEGAT